MSRLRIYDESHADAAELAPHDHADIAHALAAVGVRFEQWQAASRSPRARSRTT